jgi:hypothetical protein
MPHFSFVKPPIRQELSDNLEAGPGVSGPGFNLLPGQAAELVPTWGFAGESGLLDAAFFLGEYFGDGAP